MIDILMAVYNGEKFLSQQIDSIISQTEQNWRLIISDDCSDDRSYEIASGYASEYPDKIILRRNEDRAGSAQGNFVGMLGLAESDYIMFSDHDDVWLPDKIEKTLTAMEKAEKECGGKPVLVHGELSVTDSSLNITAERFTAFQGLDPSANTLNRLMAQNNVTGCTVMINSSLLELVRGVPSDRMLMHDWWFALAAAAFGVVAFVDEPLIKYRQHGNNQLGAVNNRSLKGIAGILKYPQKARKRINDTYSQAQAFYEVYKDKLPQQQRICVERYLSIPEKNKLSRMATLIRYNYLKQNFLAAAGQIFFC